MLWVISSLQPPLAADDRLPIPGNQQIEACREVAREAIEAIARASNNSSADMAPKVYTMVETESSPDRKMALLEEFYSWSINKNDIYQSMQSLDLIELTFLASQEEKRIETSMQLLGDKRSASERMFLLGKLISAVRELEEKGLNEKGLEVLQQAKRFIPKDHRKEAGTFFTKYGKLLEGKAQRRKDYEIASREIAASPDDQKLHMAIGSYLLFVADEKKEGFEHLARGSDLALAEVCAKELGFPASQQEKKALADAWWQLSSQLPSDFRPWIAGRAAFWYGQCIDSLGEVEAVIARDRIALGEDGGLIPFRTADLLALEIVKHLQSGAYDEASKSVYLRSSKESRCAIDSIIPESCDVQFRFTRTAGEYGIRISLPAYFRRVDWCYAGSRDPLLHLDGFGERDHSTRIVRDLPDGIEHHLELQIRPNSFSAKLDGKTLQQIRSPFATTIAEKRKWFTNGSRNQPMQITDHWGNLLIKELRVVEYK